MKYHPTKGLPWLCFFRAIHAVSTEIYLSDGSTILATVAPEVEGFDVRHIRGRKEEYAKEMTENKGRER